MRKYYLHFAHEDPELEKLVIYPSYEVTKWV